MTDTRELTVIRHGHAHCNHTGTIAGSKCNGLTDFGTAQAGATAAHLRTETSPVVAVHTSTTRRARQTADIFATALGLTAVPEPDLCVPDPGSADGLPWPDARQRWLTDPANPTRPLADDAESWDAYLRRATSAIDRLLHRHPGGRIIVVGHGETLTALMHLLFGTATLGRLKIAFDHCALTTLQASRGGHSSATTTPLTSPNPRSPRTPDDGRAPRLAPCSS